MKILYLVLALLMLAGCKSEEEKAQHFFERGDQFLSAHDYSSAELEFKNAVKLNPYHTQALYGIATIYELKKRWSEMEATLLDILDKDPGFVDARIKLTNLYLGQNRIDKALTHTETLLKQAPNSNVAKTLRAAVLFKIDDASSARELLQQVLEESPDYIDAVVLQAHDSMIQGNAAAAVEQLEKALNASPESLVLNIVMLQALSKSGDFERSVEVYRKLIELYPDNENIPMSLARLYYSNGKSDEAILLLEHQAEVHKNTEFLFKALEITNEVQGLQAAESLTKSYLRRYPALPRLNFALVDIYVKGDKLPEALQQLNSIWDNSSEPKMLIEAGLRKARLELMSRDLEGAGKTIARLETLDSSSPGVAVVKADYLIANNDEGGAIRTLRAALRQSPNNADIAVTLAKAHERQGDWGLANEYYTTAVRAPDGIQYGEAFAEYLVKRNELVKAEQLLNQMLKHGRATKKVFRLLAQIKLAQGEWQEVEELANQIEKDLGEGPETAYIRGLAASGRQDFVAAAEAMERLQSMAPNSVRSMVLLVDAYIRAGKREEAEDFLNRVITTDPSSFYGYFLRGNLRSYFHEWQAAEQDYKIALQHKPDSEEAFDTLARLYIRQGDVQQAAKLLDDGIKRLPQSIKLTALRAEIFRRDGHLAEAVSLYRALFEQDQTVDVVANNLASLLLGQGEQSSLAEALKLAERFRQSKIPQYLDTLGWAYVLAGQYTDGLSLLRRASEALPEASEIKYHLAEGYYRNNELDKAQDAVNEALEGANQQVEWYAAAAALQQKMKSRE